MNSDQRTVWVWVTPFLDFQGLLAISQTSRTFFDFMEVIFQELCRTDLNFNRKVTRPILFPVRLVEPEEVKRFIEIQSNPNSSWRSIFLSGLGAVAKIRLTAIRQMVVDRDDIIWKVANFPSFWSNRVFNEFMKKKRASTKDLTEFQDHYKFAKYVFQTQTSAAEYSSIEKAEDFIALREAYAETLSFIIFALSDRVNSTVH